MLSFTFEVIEKNFYNLYDIFSNTIIDKGYDTEKFLVTDREEARMDLISMKLYGSIKYVEELLVINNILNPFSIKKGDIIKFVPITVLTYYQETNEKEIKADKVKSKNKSTRNDTNRPPTLRPENFKQVLLDKNNKTLKLNTKLS